MCTYRNKEVKRRENDFKKVGGCLCICEGRDRQRWMSLEEAFVHGQAVD